MSITNSASVSTTGNSSYALFGQSVGGYGGSGGSGDGAFGYGGNTMNCGDGGTVAVTTTGSDVMISTSGQGADAIRAQSVGGGGGSAGSATGLVALGGSGSAAGNGGTVTVNNENCLEAQGAFSYGIYAQSMGGGGGSSNPVVGALTAIGGRDSSGGDGGSVTVVNSGQISTTDSAILAQSVGGGGGSGAMAVGASITIGGSSSNGGNAAPVTVQNSNSTLETSGLNASAIYAQSLGGGGGKGGSAVAGGAGLSVAIGQSGGQGGWAGPVTVDVTGSSMQTSGLMSDGINAQSVGGGGGSGGFSVAVDAYGVLALSLGGSGGNGGYGGEVTVNYADTTILTTGNYQSHGVFAQSVGGGGGSGGFSAAVSNGPVSAAISLGGSAGSGGAAGAVTFTDTSLNTLNSAIQTAGEQSHGLFLQSVGGGGGHGGFSISGNATLAGAAVNIGGSGGDGGSGYAVTLQDTGIGAPITTTGSKSCGILAQSVGGGGGDAGFSVAGSLGVEGSAAVSLGGSGGLGGNGGNVSAELNRTITTEGDAAAGILLQSVGGGGGNGGFSVAGSMTVSPPSGSGATINAAVSLGGSGGSGGNGGQVSLSASEGSTVTTGGLGSVGILAQSVGGGGGNGGFSVAGALSFSGTPAGATAGVSLGGTGGSGGSGSQVTVSLADSVTTTGNLASGVLAQSVGGGGGNGGFAVTGSLAFGSNDVTGVAAVSVGGSGGSGGTGGDVNCTSSGTISTQGIGADGLVGQSVGGGGGNGGFAVAAGASVIAGSTYQVTVGGGAGGSGGSGGDGGQVILANSGQVTTRGGQATGVMAQSVGGGGGNGGFGAAGICNFDPNSSKGATLSAMVGGYGGSGGDGGQVGLTNSGQVTTLGEQSTGVLAQSVGGGGGNGGFSANLTFNKQTFSASVDVGGSGGSGGQGNSVSVTNTGTIITLGGQSTGLLAQSVGGGGGNAGFGAAGNIDPGSTTNMTFDMNLAIGGNGGSGGDGKDSTVYSHGDAISTMGDSANGIFVQSVGGGGGNANFSLNVVGSGSNAMSRGSSDVPLLHLGSIGGGGGNGGTAFLENYSSINTGGSMSDGILVQSVGGGGGKGSMEISGRVSYSSGTGTLKLGASGTDGAGGGNGGLVTVNDILAPGQTSKNIVTRGYEAAGIAAQSIGAGGGKGGDSYSLAISNDNGWLPSTSLALGGSGGAGGQAADVAVTTVSDISTQGFMAYGILAQSIGGGGGDGGRAVSADISGQISKMRITGVSAALGGNGGNGGQAGKVSVDASGDAIQTSDACGILAQSVGGGGGSGGASISLNAALSRSNLGVSASVSLGGNGGSGGQADAVTVTSSSVINTFDPNALTPGMPSLWSPGILAQSIGGGGGAGGFSIAGDFNAVLGQADVSADCTFSLGGNGGDGNTSGAVSVTSTGAIITTGFDISPGILAQSVAGGGGHGGFSIAGDLNGANTKNFNGEMSISVGGSGGTGGAASNVTVSNAGSINTGFVDSQGNVWGYKSPGLAAQSIGGGGGDGGFSVAGDVNFQGNQAISGRIGGALDASGDGGSGGQAGSVCLTHSGAGITTVGDKAAAIVGQSLGGGGGDGGFAVAGNLMITPSSDSGPNSMGCSLSIGGSGGSGGAGGDVTVNITNPGNTLATQGYLSPGIQAQSIGGGGGNGGFSVAGGLNINGPGQLSLAMGGEGGFGNIAGKVTVADQGASISTAGDVAPGIQAQSIGGGGGNGNFGIGYGFGAYSIASAVTTSITSLLAGTGGNGGGGGNADQVQVTSSSWIVTKGQDSPGIIAQSIGAGGGNGGFSVRGQMTSEMPGFLNVGASNGASGSGNNVTVNAGQAGITTSGERAAGILAQSIGGGGGVSWISIDSDGFQAGNGTLAIGGQNSSGDGGTVLVQNQTGKPSQANAISTTGVNAIGILAQSIGGGGGVGSNDALGKSSVTISGSNSASGNGGQASVVSQSDITTSAIGAYGIMAQSIGGGGGLALNYIPGSLNSLQTTMPAGDGTNQGDGGAINVTTTGTLRTSGGAAIGLVAQSLGGGGGLDVSGGNAGSAGGQGSGGAISIDNTGTISTSGTYAHGIFAQSAGGQGSGGSVTISNEGAIALTGTLAHGIVAVSSGQYGAGAITITNYGTGSILGATDGTTPIYLVGGSQNTIYNYGSITATGEPVQGSYRYFYQNGTLKAGSLSVDNKFTNTGTLTAGSIVVNPGGIFTQSGGTLAVSSDSAPGGGALNINSGTLQASGGSHTLGNDLKVSGDFALGGTNNFTLVGAVDLGGATRTITVTNPGDTNLSGSISNGGLSIDNTGGGSLTLSGANTYTGITTLNSGTLLAGNNKAFNPTDGAELIIKGGTIGASAPVITINIPVMIDSDFNMGGPVGTNLKLTSDMNLSGFLLTHSGAGNDILSGDLTCSAVAGTGICVTGGTLNLTGNNVNYVATSTVKGGTLNLQGAANYTGDNVVSGGILNMNSAVNHGRAGGTNTITGGIVNMSGTEATYLNDSTVTGGVLNLSAGTYNGKLDLGANGTFNYTGGAFAPTGGANMTAGAGSTITLASGLHLNLGAGNTMTHNGTFNIGSGSRLTGTVIGNGGGTTTVNGTVIGDVINNGTLMGSGTISGNFTSNGIVNPGNSPGTLTVGTYTPGAGNTQVVEIASASNYDKIVTTAAGGAVLNGTLSPRLLGGYLPSTNTEFNVIQTTGGGTVSGAFTGIDNTRVGSSRTLFWQALYTPTTADLKAVGNYTPPDLALSRNQRSVGNTLNSLAPSTTGGDMLTALDAINALTTDSGVRAAYNEISPGKYAALASMSMPITHLQFQYLQNRLARERWEGELGSESVSAGGGGFMRNVNFGYESNTKMMLAASNMTISDAGTRMINHGVEQRWGVYLEPMANWGNTSATANMVGYRYKNFGFTLGAEYWVLDNLLVGVNTGYSKTLGSSGGSGGDLNANVIPVNAYGAFFHQGFYANAAVGYTYSGYDMTRNVVFGTINRTAQASTSGNQFQIGAETGYDAKIGNAVVGPVLSLQYVTQTVGGFTESNAGALSLKVGSQSADSVQSGLGARASYKAKLGNVPVKPQLSVTWQHEFSDNTRGLNASLAAGGSTINFQTDRIGQDFALISLDVPAKITKNLVANVGYTAEVGRDKSTNMGVNIGLKLKW
ncbi:MAG: hypothetical protein M0P73_10575 [Syntrophobacterales bacterium]|nr:hypothetical protein [Syntrophobacterales bacterium]